MPEVYSIQEQKSCYWDFDEGGGAVSSIDLGFEIPDYSIVTRFYVLPVTTLTSGGAATISVNASATPQLYIVQQPYSNFVAGQPVGGIDLSTPIQVGNGNNTLLLNIFDAALTAGRLIFFIEYTKFPY